MGEPLEQPEQKLAKRQTKKRVLEEGRTASEKVTSSVTVKPVEKEALLVTDLPSGPAEDGNERNAIKKRKKKRQKAEDDIDAIFSKL